MKTDSQKTRRERCAAIIESVRDYVDHAPDDEFWSMETEGGNALHFNLKFNTDELEFGDISADWLINNFHQLAGNREIEACAPFKVIIDNMPSNELIKYADWFGAQQHNDSGEYIFKRILDTLDEDRQEPIGSASNETVFQALARYLINNRDAITSTGMSGDFEQTVTAFFADGLEALLRTKGNSFVDDLAFRYGHEFAAHYSYVDSSNDCVSWQYLSSLINRRGYDVCNALVPSITSAEHANSFFEHVEGNAIPYFLYRMASAYVSERKEKGLSENDILHSDAGKKLADTIMQYYMSRWSDGHLGDGSVHTSFIKAIDVLPSNHYWAGPIADMGVLKVFSERKAELGAPSVAKHMDSKTLRQLLAPGFSADGVSYGYMKRVGDIVSAVPVDSLHQFFRKDVINPNNSLHDVLATWPRSLQASFNSVACEFADELCQGQAKSIASYAVKQNSRAFPSDQPSPAR